MTTELKQIFAAASDPNDLERHILDPNIAKSEAEWWAKSRIEELHADLADALDCKSGDGPTALSMVIKERDQLRKDVTLLREVMNRIAFSRVGKCENIALELFNREAWATEALAATEPKE